MDIDKLIERLTQYSQSLIAYKLGADFADACMDAATALSTLQAENEKLRADLEYEREHADAYYEECGQWEAENEKLRAENIRWGQVASEQDKAIDNLRKELEWKDMVIELAQRKEREAKAELEQVKRVRCKDCKMSRPGVLGYVWCGPTAMPLDGFCSNGQQKED